MSNTPERPAPAPKRGGKPERARAPRPKAEAPHLALGRAGEERALLFLQSRGYAVLERNWRPSGALRGFELDMVARDGDTLVFVEVKTRAEAGGIPVHAAFTAKKRARMARAARMYLAVHELWDLPCRFDLICATGDGSGGLILEHHRNVIEFGKTVDNRHASWQPW